MPGKDVELEFPLSGIDVTTEFQEQKPGTTPEAINVRGYDPIARRARGGSRPGINHYAPDAVPANTALDMTIQHLAVIVDPHATALPQNFETPGDDWVEDPLNPGTFVPPGGWGNPGGAPDADVTLAIVQSKVAGYDFTAVEETTNFDSTPGSGAFLYVVVVTLDNDLTTTVTVTNGALNAYTQQGGYKRIVHGLGPELSISIWRKIAADGASEAAVKVAPSSQTELKVGMIEFSGPSASPIGNTSQNSGSAATMTTGAMVALEGDAVIGAFSAAFAPDTVTPGAGFTLTINSPDGSVDNTDIQLYVITKLGQAAGSVDPEATFAGGADTFVAIGLCIHD